MVPGDGLTIMFFFITLFVIFIMGIFRLKSALEIFCKEKYGYTMPLAYKFKKILFVNDNIVWDSLGFQFEVSCNNGEKKCILAVVLNKSVYEL